MCYLPLYQDTQEIKFNKLNSPNAGLWFDKFFSDYNKEFTKIEIEKQMYKDIVQPKVLPSTKVLSAYNKRQTKLIKSLGGSTKEFSTQWHFVTGMGQNHPTENGFTWHPLLGVPYLTASGISGLLSHWVRYYLEDAELAQRWFGSGDEKNTCAGELSFFDALPTEKPKIIVDIMAPHYRAWYKNGAQGRIEDSPHDSHKVIPISFLVVEKARFSISISSRLTGEAAGSDINRAFEELQFALENLGAGAKTSSGYGRLEQVISEDEKYDQNKKRRE